MIKVLEKRKIKTIEEFNNFLNETADNDYKKIIEIEKDFFQYSYQTFNLNYAKERFKEELPYIIVSYSYKSNGETKKSLEIDR